MSADLPNPFRKDVPPPPQSPSGVTGRDWARLYIMAVVLFMVVGTMLYMKEMADTSTRKSIRPPGPGEIDYTVKRPTYGEAQEPGGGQTLEGKERKEIPISPLPKDGEIDFRALAAPFRDGTEPVVKETPEFVNLLNVFMNAVTSEGLAKQVQAGLTVDQAYLDPQKHRGDVLRCYGRLIYIYPEPLYATTPNNVELVYLGILQEYPTNRTAYFYMPELPRDPQTGKLVAFDEYTWKGQRLYRDWVNVEGVFLRQYVYPSQWEERGRTVHAKAAVIFAKTLRMARSPEFSDPRGGFVFVVGSFAVALAGIAIFAGMMSRKYSAGSFRIKMFQLRQKRGKGATSGTSPEKGLPEEKAPETGSAEAPSGGGGRDPRSGPA